MSISVWSFLLPSSRLPSGLTFNWCLTGAVEIWITSYNTAFLFNVLHGHFFPLHSSINLLSSSNLHKAQISYPRMAVNTTAPLPLPSCLCAAGCSQEWHFDLILIELHLIFFKPFLQFIKICFSPPCKALSGATPTSRTEHFYSPEYTWSVGMLTYNNQKFVKLSLFIIQWGEYWKGANKGETLEHEASGADLQGLQLREHHQGKKCGDAG